MKPPKVSGDKPWHQDAAYFRGSDPGLMFGVWIALDPATRENGCMEVIPGSQLRGPVPHVPAEDINLCTIRPDLVRLADRVALPMDPGDVLVFHSLIHHYTAANRTDRRRRALQFHYHQVGLEWTSLEAHRVMYHDADGAYAGCTVPKARRSPRRPVSCRAGCGRSCRWHRLQQPTSLCASGEMVTAGVSKTPGGNSLPVRVRPRANSPPTAPLIIAAETMPASDRAARTRSPSPPGSESTAPVAKRQSLSVQLPALIRVIRDMLA